VQARAWVQNHQPKTAGLDEGKQGRAEGRLFAGPGELIAGDAMVPEGGGEPTGDPLANAGFVGYQVGDLPVLEPGGETFDQLGSTRGVLEMTAALVDKDIDREVGGNLVKAPHPGGTISNMVATV